MFFAALVQAVQAFLTLLLGTAFASSSPTQAIRPVIGIDFGTTFSTVAVFHNGTAQVIPNDFGQISTPSIVSFTDGRIVIGEVAIPHLIDNPRNTIFAFKRLIGGRLSDPDMRDTIDRLPYKLLEKDDQIYVEITFQGVITQLSAEQIIALFLTKMKTIAEDHLGMEIKDAVLTVPLSFGERERRAMKAAAEIAGLEVLRFLPEPVAIALSADHDTPRSPSKPEANIILFHLGGGVFDVSLMSPREKGWKCLASAGIARLGGEDFDRRIVDVCITEFNRGDQSDARAMARLREAATNVKHYISGRSSGWVTVDSFKDGLKLCSYVPREKFEEWNDDYFKTIVASLDQVLQDAGVAKSAIDEIWFVGGSTNIPKIQNLVKDFVNRRVTTRTINRSTTVASGAAIAGSWQMRDPKAIDAWAMTKNPHSIGVQFDNGTIQEVIHRNSCANCTTTIQGTTTMDYQRISHVRIFQGDEGGLRAYRLVNELSLQVPTRPKGEVNILVEVSTDSDHFMTVSADYEIHPDASDVPADPQLARARVELHKFLAGDARAKEKAMTWTKVKQLLASAKEAMDQDDMNDTSLTQQRREYEKMVLEIETRLAKYP
jgi:heat shock protein 5